MSTAETDAQIINPEMPDVPPHAPSKINLKDYTKPSFDVDTVHLDIKLFEDYAQVDSTLEMVRQTAGDIVLFGESLELLTITMNGKTATMSAMTMKVSRQPMASTSFCAPGTKKNMPNEVAAMTVPKTRLRCSLGTTLPTAPKTKT